MTARAACLASSVGTLVVLLAAAVVVASLPELVTIPGTLAVGARGLAAGCLAVLYGVGVAVQPWLLPYRNATRPRQEGAGGGSSR